VPGQHIMPTQDARRKEARLTHRVFGESRRRGRGEARRRLLPAGR
jgi:hypothetical protein